MTSAGSTFRTAEPDLTKVLEQVHAGALQLPDFQRGWVWDDRKSDGRGGDAGTRNTAGRPVPWCGRNAGVSPLRSRVDRSRATRLASIE